jgi:aspartyl-tRNA(Asn)/glutamyl-tRNA(Gln) amidotransferase subunit C
VSITPEEVRRVAKLARLHLSDDEVELYTDQLSQILSHASRIKELDTKDVPSTSHPLKLANVWREDRPHTCLPPDTVLSQAPATEDGMFKVPRIIEVES